MIKVSQMKGTGTESPGNRTQASSDQIQTLDFTCSIGVITAIQK